MEKYQRALLEQAAEETNDLVNKGRKASEKIRIEKDANKEKDEKERIEAIEKANIELNK